MKLTSKINTEEIAKDLAVLHAAVGAARLGVNDFMLNYQQILTSKLKLSANTMLGQLTAAQNTFKQIYALSTVQLSDEQKENAQREQKEVSLLLYSILKDWALTNADYAPYAEHILQTMPTHIQYYQLQKQLEDFEYQTWCDLINLFLPIMGREITVVLQNDLKMVFEWNVTPSGYERCPKNDRQFSLYSNGKVIVNYRKTGKNWVKMLESNAKNIAFAQLMNMADQLITWSVIPE